MKNISKVAFFLNVFPKLSETFILNQIIGLARLGIYFEIYSISKPTETFFHEDIKVFNLLEKVRYLPNITAVEYLGKFDIVHCHFGTAGVFACALRRCGLLEGKLITSFHGFDVNVKHFTKSYYKNLIRLGDYYTVNTRYTLKKVIALGFPGDRIAIIHEGVNTERFHPKHRINLNDNIIRILTVGRLVAKKGTTYALDALEILQNQYGNNYKIVFDIIGDGPLYYHLNEQVQQKGLKNVVTLHGAKNSNDVLQFLKIADIFVLPSVEAENGDSEGQALVLQEAQAMGIPVLSTFHNGIPEAVKNNVTGFLVSPGNSEELAAKLWELIINPNLRMQMGKNGRAFVELNFDIETLNQNLINIYTNLHNGMPIT